MLATCIGVATPWGVGRYSPAPKGLNSLYTVGRDLRQHLGRHPLVGQSPERTTLPHPDMQCRVFIIRRMTMPGRSHRSHAAAHASEGMTWLLSSAAATDARPRTSQRRPAKSAETRPLSPGQAAAGRPKDAATGHGNPRFRPFQTPCFSPVRALH